MKTAQHDSSPRCECGRWPLVLLIVILIFSPCASLPAEELSNSDELQARVEAMLHENRLLRKALDEQRLINGSEHVVPAGYEDESTGTELELAAGSNAGAESKLSPEEARIRNIVKQYLEEREAKQKTDAEKKKAEADAAGYEMGTDLSMKATWKNGFEVESPNKDFRVHVGGRTQLDGALFHSDRAVQTDPRIVNPIGDGVDFRRARLRVDGTMYDQIEWIVEYDFMNSVLALPSQNSAPNAAAVPAPTDLYWTFIKLPVVGNFRVGNQKEPIGFDHLVSSRFLPFMERSFNQDAFYGAFNNGFTPGLAFYNTALDERFYWSAGVFKPTNNVFAFNTDGGEYSATGRIAALPWYVDEGRGLMHLGLSARTAGFDDGFARFRTRGPERGGISQVWPLYADSGRINGSGGQQMINSEFAMNLGSLTIQAEYLVNFVHNASVGAGPNVGTLLYHGGYVETSYFLTGEHRDYNRKNAVFDRVVPIETAFFVPSACGKLFGRGAWQIAARYNYLDLNSKGINGGRLNDLTLGLNWFLNPNMKVQCNYSITERDSPDPTHNGLIQGFGMRLAHDF